MFFYARADTHFLLYIYDHMRNELIDRTNADIPEENRIEQVLQKSKETSLLRYERTVYNADSGRGPGGWYSLLVKTPALFNNEQFAVFRAVHEWRDKVARADDDSPSFVMPQHVIFSIAKLMPMDMVGLLGIAHPVSHSVKSRAGELLAVIKSAKARGKSGPSIIDVLRPDSVGAVVKANLPVVAADNTAPKTLVAVVDESQLRSESSTFWGGAFGSSLWEGPTLTHNEMLRLAVPLPTLSSEIFASSNGLANRSVVDREAPSEPKGSRNQPQKEEEAFVIRRGAKRKSDVISDEEEAEQKKPKSSSGYQISVEDIAAARAGREKAAQKGARKAEKRAKKAAKKAAAAAAETGGAESADVNDDDDDDDDDEDEEPFDYSKADSILHGKRHDGEKGGTKKEKPFDPYRKSEDAPKGMRRLQTERAGKSHTFKN
jgi:exosome complex exonuclease RRP6